MVFQHDNIMVIYVIIFTPLASVWHIQGHVLHLYIMGNADVHWPCSGPILQIKNDKQNDVVDDNAGETAMTDITIAFDNEAVKASIEEDEGNHLWR